MSQYVKSILFRKDALSLLTVAIVVASFAISITGFVIESTRAAITTETSTTLITGAHGIVQGSNPVPVLGLNIAVGAGETLDSVLVTFANTSGFDPTVDLAALDTSAGSGVALYNDGGSADKQFDATDSVVSTTSVACAGGGNLDCTIDASAVALPINDDDGGSDFFVAIRTHASNIIEGNAFTVAIDAAGDVVYSTGASVGMTTSITGAITADATGPTVSSRSTGDSDNDGKIDFIDVTFNENLDDDFSSLTAVVTGYTVASYSSGAVEKDTILRAVLTEIAGTCNDSDQTGCDSDAVPTVRFSANSSLRDRALGGEAVTTTANVASRNGNLATAEGGLTISTDNADPVVKKVTTSVATGLNTIVLIYSEAVTVTCADGASENGCGDYSAGAGLLEGFGTFAAGDAATNGATDNTIAGSTTDTITISIAAQATGYIASASTTVPSGNFTPSADAAGVTDGGPANTVNTTAIASAAGTAWDLTKPGATITVSDANADGQIETATLVFSESIRDNSVTNGDAALSSTAGTTTGTFVSGAADDTTTVFSRTNDTGVAVDTALGSETNFTYSGATTLIRDTAGNLYDGTADGAIATADEVEVDGADPIVVSVTKSLTSSRNRLSILYSEIVTVTNGASTSSSGDMTTAGTVAGFGSFATTGNATVNTTKNTVGGSGSATITIDLADQTGGAITTTASPGTEIDGAFTPVSSSAVVDTASRQVATTATSDTAGDVSWDLTRPTLTSITVADSANNDGEIDRAVLVFNTPIRDANVANGDATLGSGGTTTGAFSTDVPNDETTVFNRTVDDNGVNTAASAGDFIYSGTTSKITDLAGNMVDLTTDGQIASGDSTEADAANPILTSVVFNTSSGLNTLAFGYSEAITIDNGTASDANRGALTSAGTIAGFGDFATNGNAVTNAAGDNSIAGSGTSTITISFTNQTAGYWASASTTASSGDVTPLAHADVHDASSNQVNTIAAVVPPSTTAAWDLTKPGVTITVSDVDSDGEVETATLVFSESVRDISITNGDASLGAAGIPTGSFVTGTANDATTVFSRTDDNTANTTGLGAHTDFVYTGATTLIRDTAGNLYDGTADGAIATADEVEVDGADPIVVSVTKSLTSSRNRLSILYSEIVTVTNGASTSSKGDMTTAGVIAGFGSFATTGNATVNTTKNTVGGSGSATITIDLADVAGGAITTVASPGTELDGAFTPVSSSAVVDTASRQVATTATSDTAGDASWDLARPAIASVTISDQDNDGRIDRAVLILDAPMRDSNLTAGDGSIGGVVGTFTTGVADDSTTTFNATDDSAVTVDTSAEGQDFLYSGLTTVMTDLAGNKVDTATDGAIVDVDTTQADTAKPVLTTVTFGTSGGYNSLAFAYSENILLDNGATSSAGRGALTDPGTVSGVVNFTTNGLASMSDAGYNTLSVSTSTLTVVFANQTNAYWDAGATTGPSVSAAPLAHADIHDASNNTVNTSASAVTPANNYTTGGWDLVAPTVSSITFSDSTGNNGKIDRATVVFSENVDDTYILAAPATLGATGTTTGTFTSGTADDTTTAFNRTDDSAVDTDSSEGDFLYTATGATNYIRDLAGNILGTVTTPGSIDSDDVTETDGANPVIVSVVKTTSSLFNAIQITYSESIIIATGDGASEAGQAAYTTAGTLAGFGSFATAGDAATSAVGANTIDGSGTAVITVTLAAQNSGYFVTASSTEPSGVFTASASASVTDGTTNQVNTSATVTSSSAVAWDLTKPIVSTVTISDQDADGRIDRAVVVLDSAMRDINLTNGDGAIGGVVGTFTSGIANDATTTFNATDDSAVSQDTSAETSDFTYSAATTPITDFAGNIINTTTDGSFVDIDVTQTDGANPILISITKSSSSSLNRLTLVYSEAVTISSGNGASTADVADYTVAGTLDAFGTFATAGDTAVNAATASTVAGSGTTTVTIDLAAQTAGYLVTASTTEPSGVFTPVADSDVVDAATNTVNAGNAPTTVSGSAWDLTKPGATITVSDADNDGEIETATLVFSEAIRDISITNADATLGTDGTETGTFATGTANDATTVFSRTDDNTADDTDLGAHTDFVYTGATTLIRDSAGNLYNGAVDGAIASGDETEVDGAAPIIVTGVYSDSDASGKIDTVTLTYSESVTFVVEAGDWIFGTAGSINMVGDYPDADCTTGSATIVCTDTDNSSVTADANETGGVTNPIWTYNNTDADGSVTDGANVALGEDQTITDGARPILLSSSPANSGVLIPATANFTLTFSEDLLDGSVTTSTVGVTTSPISTPTYTVSESAGVVTVDPSGATFGPGVTATVTMTTGLTDATANTFNTMGLVTTEPYSFTTQNPSSSGGGGGGGGASTVSVTADAVTMTSPNGGEVLTGGAQADLTWTSTGNINNVNLYYSVDGGSAFGLIAAGTSNDGAYSWNVPNTATGQALVKIVGRDSGGATLATDQSNATFTINVDSAIPVEQAPTGSGEVSVPTGSMSRTDAETSLPESINVDYLVKVANDGDPTTDYDSTVYYIGLDAKRHPFVNGQVYFTWYENFDTVRTIEGSVLSQIALGTPVLTRPGTMMVKIQSDARTFAVEPGDYTIRWVPSEEVAVALYGSAWNQRIMDIEPTYWSRFTLGSDLTADLHPAGSVLKDADGTKYYFDGVNKRAFATDEAFTANMFQNKYVIDQPASTGWSSTTAGSAIVGFEDALFSLQR